MGKIYLIRHGQTEWNADKRLQGRLNSPLTEKGRGQAGTVATILARELGRMRHIDLVSSPLGRAVETAEIISRRLGLPVTQDERLAEIDIGAWSGFTYPQILAGWRERLFSAREDDWLFHAPGGENFQAVADRVGSWLRDVSGDVIAVAHGISGKVLRGLYAGFDRSRTLALAQPQDAVFRLEDGAITMLTSEDQNP